MERVDSLLEALGRSAQNLAALHTMTIIEENVYGEADAKVEKPLMWHTTAMYRKFFQ